MTGKRTLIVLVATFLAGFIIAFALLATGWRPGHTRNYGELVQPARPLPDATLMDLKGEAVSAHQWRGKWTLVYFGSSECLTPCTEALYKMRQLVAAQGREAHRLRSVFILTDTKARDVLRYTLEDYPTTSAVTGSASALRELAMPFGAPGTLNGIYIVDPLGNFMMRYPADADLRRMNKDIRVLLKTSQVG
jgi:cytochrome oxidase Cu insertion factor (SCO1/SenC/PrrC family)